jgi:peptidoglycan-associated lipoprotein
MRLWPALCAGLMLAACANEPDSGSRGRDTDEPPVSSGFATPGTVEYREYGYISDRVYFQTDSDLLQPEAQQMLQKQALWLSDYAQHTITIEGYADERGTREYNLALGERRADAVMRYLNALGVDSKRLKTTSYGKERPTCIEANEACWNQNRRAVSTLDQ